MGNHSYHLIVVKYTIGKVFFFMKKSWIYFISGFVGVIVIISFVVPVTIHFLGKGDTPIVIWGDADFGKYHFPGKGTTDDPYIIDSYIIITEEDYAISIVQTTKHFIIQNCVLQARISAINLFYVAAETAKINSNVCSNSARAGIYIDISAHVSIVNNTCYNNFEHYDSSGIELIHSPYAEVINNSCSFNSIGIYFREDCSHSVISDNTCFYNKVGIYFDFGLVSNLGYCTLTNNRLIHCGILLDTNHIHTFSTFSIENNLVNGKKFDYFYDVDNITITDPSLYGQLYFVECSEITVHNQNLSDAIPGLYISSSENVDLDNNIVTGGISLYYVTNASVTNNVCSNSSEGIDVYSYASILIANNTCMNCSIGVSLGYGSNSSLINNTCSNNMRGIDLIGVNATLIGNTCSNNTQTGISLKVTTALVVNNTINKNLIGMRLAGSKSCLITFNTFKENANYSLTLVYDFEYHRNSTENVIHHNSFISNNVDGTSQALDNGENNSWYDSGKNEGNYWSDWMGGGNYTIAGSANADDPYPLINPPFPFPLLSFYGAH